MQMEMFMKVNGEMIKLMDRVSITTLMELVMRDTGKRISSMDMVKKHGQMELAMKESTKKVKRMDLESFHGLTGQHTKVHFMITTLRASVFTPGLIIDNIMVNG